MCKWCHIKQRQISSRTPFVSLSFLQSPDIYIIYMDFVCCFYYIVHTGGGEGEIIKKIPNYKVIPCAVI